MDYNYWRIVIAIFTNISKLTSKLINNSTWKTTSIKTSKITQSFDKPTVIFSTKTTKQIKLIDSKKNTIYVADYDPECSNALLTTSFAFLFERSIIDFAFIISLNELVTFYNFESLTNITDKYFIKPQRSTEQSINGQIYAVNSIKKLENNFTILTLDDEIDDYTPICTLKRHVIIMNQLIKLYQFKIIEHENNPQNYYLENNQITEIVLKYKDENEPCFLAFLDMDENSDSFNMIRNDLCFYQSNSTYLRNISKDQKINEIKNLSHSNILIGTLKYRGKYFLIGNVVNYDKNQIAFAFFVVK